MTLCRLLPGPSRLTWALVMGVAALLIGFSFIVPCPNSYGQTAPPTRRLMLSGQVRDAATGLPLPGSGVYAHGYQTGVATGLEGEYSLQILGDTVTLRFHAVGYKAIKRFYDRSTLAEEILLEAHELDEVVVTARPSGAIDQVNRTEMGIERLDMRQAKALPALLGEVDPIRLLQLRPGVQSGGEGTTGLFVRGGGADQNLFLLDGAVLYNPSHLFGFLSVFNPDALDRVELHKGGFSPDYGGRLSSVVDVWQRSGNPDTLKAHIGVGLIASRATIEGPLPAGHRSSFLISARRTYFDVFTRQYNRYKLRQDLPRFNPIPDYHFTDLNARVQLGITPRDVLILSGFIGDDQFQYRRNDFGFRFNWGNRAWSARLVHTHSPRMFSEAQLTISDYHYQISNQFDQFQFRLGSGIRDYTARVQWTLLDPERGHEWRAGITGTRHTFTIGRAQGTWSDNSFSFATGQQVPGNEFGAYVQDRWQIGRRTEVLGGVRLSGFTNGARVFTGLEPRLIARHNLSERFALKAAYGRMYQYLHLVASSGASLPTDLWYPSTDRVPPQLSDQISAGYHVALPGGQGGWFLSHEAYYKRMAGQIDFKDGANLFVNRQLDTTFVFGKGWAYGTEWMLEKRRGRTTGWLAYTLSYTWRQFDQINEGRPFHPRHDRRHDISLVVNHQLSSRWSLSGTFVYGTGNAVTMPIGRAITQDLDGATPNPPGFQITPLYGPRNNYRMAAYHRADIAAVYKLGTRRRSDLTFSIYNIYNRLNPFFLYVETLTDQPRGRGNVTGFQARQVSLFPIIPAITYNATL